MAYKKRLKLKNKTIFALIFLVCALILTGYILYSFNRSKEQSPASAIGGVVNFTNPTKMYRGVGIAFEGFCNQKNTAGGYEQPDWNRFSVSDRDIQYLKGLKTDYVIMQITGPVSWKNIAYSGKPSNPLDHTDPKYDFSYLDISVKKLREAGIEPVVQTWSVPSWSSGVKGDLVRDGHEAREGGGRFYNNDGYCGSTDDIRDTVTAPIVITSDGQNGGLDENAYGDFMKAMATRYNGNTPLDMNLSREFMIVGNKVFTRTIKTNVVDTDPRYNNNWRAMNLQEYYGSTPVSDSAYPLPLDQIDAHVFLPNGKDCDVNNNCTMKYREVIVKGNRFWERKSYDGGMTWMGQVSKGNDPRGEAWYTGTLESGFAGSSVARSYEGEYLNPPSGLNTTLSWGYRQTGEGTFIEDVTQVDSRDGGRVRTWWRYWSNYGATGTNIKNYTEWETAPLDIAWVKAGGSVPPRAFASKGFYPQGKKGGYLVTREFVVLGNDAWYRNWEYVNGNPKVANPAWTKLPNFRDSWINAGVPLDNNQINLQFQRKFTLSVASIDGGTLSGANTRINNYLLMNEPNHFHFWKGGLTVKPAVIPGTNRLDPNATSTKYTVPTKIVNGVTVTNNFEVSMNNYAAIANNAYDKIKSANPQAVIIGPNLTPGTLRREFDIDVDYRAIPALEYLLTKSLKFDVLGIHMYQRERAETVDPTLQCFATGTTTPTYCPTTDGSYSFSQNLQQIIDLMNKYPAVARTSTGQLKKIMNTESGYVFDGNYPLKASHQRSDKQLTSYFYPQFVAWTNFLVYDYVRVFDTGFMTKSGTAYNNDNEFYREFAKEIEPTTINVYTRTQSTNNSTAQLQLLVNNVPVKHLVMNGTTRILSLSPTNGSSWNVPTSSTLLSYRYVHPGDLKVNVQNDLSIKYLNDSGTDMSLLIDRIEVDGIVYQTEACGTAITVNGITTKPQREVIDSNATIKYGQACNTSTPTSTPTRTPTPTQTQTPTPTVIPLTPVPTISTPFPTRVSTGTPTRVATPTPTPIATATVRPTSTPLPTPTPDTTCRFGPYNVPGKIEAENYRCGGEGVAFHETTVENQGGGYRYLPDESVDVQRTEDTGGGYNVGWTRAGEWTKYKMNVTQSGSYTINVRLASLYTGGKFRLKVDGVDVSGQRSVPLTFGWQSYTTMSIPNVNLTTGEKTFELAIEGSNGNYNYFEFVYTGSNVPSPTNTSTPLPTRIATLTPTPLPTPTPGCKFGPYAVPGRIQAENYGCDGEGVSFHETTIENLGNVYRYLPGESVDLQATADAGGGYNVGWTRAGEWIKYRMNVTQSGTYTINVRLASLTTNGRFRLKVNGVDVSGQRSVPLTFGWQSYTTMSIPNVNLTTGEKTFELAIEGSDGNYNYFDFVRTGP